MDYGGHAAAEHREATRRVATAGTTRQIAQL